MANHELPAIPTFPLHQGNFARNSIMSKPSSVSYCHGEPSNSPMSFSNPHIIAPKVHIAFRIPRAACIDIHNGISFFDPITGLSVIIAQILQSEFTSMPDLALQNSHSRYKYLLKYPTARVTQGETSRYFLASRMGHRPR